MTCTAHNDLIPVEKWQQFHEILCATGGRYLSTPRRTSEGVRVDYEFGDMVEHQRRFRMATETFSECRKDQWWRKLLRRMRMI